MQSQRPSFSLGSDLLIPAASFIPPRLHCIIVRVHMRCTFMCHSWPSTTIIMLIWDWKIRTRRREVACWSRKICPLVSDRWDTYWSWVNLSVISLCCVRNEQDRLYDVLESDFFPHIMRPYCWTVVISRWEVIEWSLVAFSFYRFRRGVVPRQYGLYMLVMSSGRQAGYTPKSLSKGGLLLPYWRNLNAAYSIVRIYMRVGANRFW